MLVNNSFSVPCYFDQYSREVLLSKTQVELTSDVNRLYSAKVTGISELIVIRRTVKTHNVSMRLHIPINTDNKSAGTMK